MCRSVEKLDRKNIINLLLLNYSLWLEVFFCHVRVQIVVALININDVDVKLDGGPSILIWLLSYFIREKFKISIY